MKEEKLDTKFVASPGYGQARCVKAGSGKINMGIQFDAAASELCKQKLSLAKTRL